MEGVWRAKPNMNFFYQKPINVRPKKIRNGKAAYYLNRNLTVKRHEFALIILFITNRRLFGEVYSWLQLEYFDAMPRDSGVFLQPLIPIREIFPKATKPGDIDLLVIPYEQDQLILHRTMAIEFKAIRAKFSKQGKSPNDFGYSQANSLLELGFPYVALGHLIISDTSPPYAWRNVSVGTTFHTEQGTQIKNLTEDKIDMMPGDLIDRAFGRLKQNCITNEIGLISAYISELANPPDFQSMWYPTCRHAELNPLLSINCLDAVAEYYYSNAKSFLDTPRFDPD